MRFETKCWTMEEKCKFKKEISGIDSIVSKVKSFIPKKKSLTRVIETSCSWLDSFFLHILMKSIWQVLLLNLINFK